MAFVGFSEIKSGKKTFKVDIFKYSMGEETKSFTI